MVYLTSVREDRRSAILCGIGGAMLAGGLLYPGAQAVTATTLIVLGAAQLAVGVLLPRLTEFEIGPAGLKTKLVPSAPEVAPSLVSEAGRLNRFAHLMCGDAELARELVEDALSTARKRRGRGGPRGAAELRALLDLLDTAEERRWLRGETDVGGSGTAERRSQDPSKRITAALGELPFHERAAFILRVDWSLPVDEIAGLLDRPPDEVRQDIEAARSRLRPFIEAQNASQDA